MKLQEVSLKKLQKLLASRAGSSIEADNSPHGVYITRHRNIINSIEFYE